MMVDVGDDLSCKAGRAPLDSRCDPSIINNPPIIHHLRGAANRGHSLQFGSPTTPYYCNPQNVMLLSLSESIPTIPGALVPCGPCRSAGWTMLCKLPRSSPGGPTDQLDVGQMWDTSRSCDVITSSRLFNPTTSTSDTDNITT
jgi:hypothetical protein